MARFSGIIPPVVTPLSQPDQLDPVGVQRIVDHLINGRVDGLFVLGTTGEGPSLPYQVRYQMVDQACETAAGRVPVLVCVTDTSLAESILLAQHAHASGAAAIVAAAPYYFATNQTAVRDWFQQLADNSLLPLLLYNMPSCVGIALATETVVELAAHPNIVGIKDSSGDLTYFAGLCEQFRPTPDFVVFMGPEELIPQAVESGADGGVCGGGNLLPHVYVSLFRAARAGDTEQIRRLKLIVDDVFEHIYRDPLGNMNLIPALKLAMSQCGLCPDVTAPPLQRVSPAHAEQIRSHLPRILELADSPLVMTTSG